MNRYSSPTPIPWDNHDAQSLFTSQRASGDVVEPPAAARARAHPDEHYINPHEAAHQTLCADQYGTNVAPATPRNDSRHHNRLDHDGDIAEHAPSDSRDAIRQSDRFDREARRSHASRERLERRTQRRTQSRLPRRRRPDRRAGPVDVVDQCPNPRAAALRRGYRSGRKQNRDSRIRELPTPTHLNQSRGVADVATDPNQVRRFATGPLHGIALGLYFILLPYVVVTKWDYTVHQTNALIIRSILVVLGIFWLAFLYQVGHNVVRLRHGHLLGRDGSAWLAGLLVAVLAVLLPTPPGAVAPFSSAHVTSYNAQREDSGWPLGLEPTDPPHHRPARPLALLSMGAVPLTLLAKRRKDDLAQHQFGSSESEIDETVELLRAYNPQLIGQIRHLIGGRIDGVITISDDQLPDTPILDTDPLVVCVLDENPGGTSISFAREGGHLRVGDDWSDGQITASVVALHAGGRLRFAHNEDELLRSLATRSLSSTLVLYIGPSNHLDVELRERAITVGPLLGDPTDPRHRPRESFRPPTVESVAGQNVRVILLRSDPQILGLGEPFAPTLRRRCVEMVTYLALHRNEPVTGDRLRTRVLTNADVDASLRTLANTASAVRRSLGADAEGPRLHPVTSSGLYVTHGVISDIEIFHSLIARARQLPIDEGAPLAHEALVLVKGEPLASVLRGFEWFLAEGYAARLQRDGEWAALGLHHEALEHGDYELAFWALEQGRLIDPYSDALVEAMARVPRLREFGGDRASRTQHETIRSSGAVAVGWSLHGLSNQVTQ